MSLPSTRPTGWRAPAPLTLLDWQRRQEAFTRSNLTENMLELSFRNRNWNVAPLVAGQLSSKLLMITESDRLQQARTYSIGANATALAVAATAGSTPREAISSHRPPSPAGLMVFADPIGSDIETYRTTSGETVEIHTPIVAASWSLWDGDQDTHHGIPVTWLRQAHHGDVLPYPPRFRGIWMTFYAPRTGDTIGVDPGQPVAVGPDGTVITAAEAHQADAAFRQNNREHWGPLSWHNELVLPEGELFGTSQPGTPQHWAATVYTVWQVMEQTGKAQLTETARHALPPAARKKLASKANTHRTRPVGDGAVRVVDLAATARPAARDTERDNAASDGRRTVQWSCRWPVPPYRRNTCQNPYLHHKLGDDALEHHTHREEIMPMSIKGPADKPLRIRGGTTFTFDAPSA
ncbi:hypothetical protein ACWGRF_23075 [Streptomyces zhihengii]